MKTLPVKLRVSGIRAEGVPYIPRFARVSCPWLRFVYIPLLSVSSHGELNPHRREPPWAGVWHSVPTQRWVPRTPEEPQPVEQPAAGTHTRGVRVSPGHTRDTDKNAKRIHKRANTDELKTEQDPGCAIPRWRFIFSSPVLWLRASAYPSNPVTVWRDDGARSILRRRRRVVSPTCACPAARW